MLITLLNQFTKELKLPKLEENVEKIYRIDFPFGTLHFLDKEKEILLWSPIHTLPSNNQEDLFIHLMKANFLGQATGGAVIGISVDEKYLTLSDVMPYELSYQEFRNRIEDFVNYLIYWQKEITHHEEKARQNLY